MRGSKLTLVGLVVLLALPSAAQRRSTRRGPLRYGEELRSAAESAARLVCRPLYLRTGAPTGELFLNHVAGDSIPLVEGFVAYRTCEINAATTPARVEGLGAWAVLDIASRHVNYPRFYLFDEARSTPSWRRNLVAYWGVFKPVDRPATLQAVVVDWQHKLIVARESTELRALEGQPLPAPRWVRRGRAAAAGESRLEAVFEFAGKTLRIPVSGRVLR